MELPKVIQNFVKFTSAIPGIGPRQATRIAFWLIHQNKKFQSNYQDIINHLFQDVAICPQCFFIMDKEKGQTLCPICRDPKRNHSVICVVEKDTDLLSIENTHKYHGVYHVLGGLLSEIDPKKIKQLTISQLLSRIKKQSSQKTLIKEVILAFSATSEGNLTSYYLEKEIKKIAPDIKITKLGRGIPHGGEIEFADAETLIQALESRKQNI